MKAFLLKAIAFYRRWLSPAFPAACRYAPTCSAYAASAVEEHGVGKGTALILRRLARCHPLSRGGWDPVPSAAKPPFPGPDSREEGERFLNLVSGKLKCADPSSAEEYR